jgi:glycerol-3-phosphate acyltransferase PlsY
MTLYLLMALEVGLAYLIGSIPTSVWVGKLFYKIDIREHGSGNAGATNTIRVLGYKAGLPVMAFDIFKGWFAVQLATIFPDGGLAADAIIWLEMALAVSAVLGHIFPVYVGFRGGKGVGTLAGVAIALFPVGLLITAVVFASTLAISRYVSLSSVVAAIAFPFIVIFVTGQHNPGLIALALFVAVFVPVTHRKNIRRLLRGEENRFDFRRKKKNTA